MNQKEQLLTNIGVVSFTLVEIGEFLDTHPDDRKALEYYQHYLQICNQLKKEFASKYYPLCMDEVVCDKEWTWGQAPLPWEGGCK